MDNFVQLNYLCYAMFRKERERKHEKKTRKMYAARDFSDKYDFALFKYPIKFVKFLIISLIRLNKFSI
jgi:hypothetical protein